MEKLIEMSRGLNTYSMIVRLVGAVLCGGIIGLERGVKGRAAGFRTHILVCLGAALTMMTGQYICQYISSASDPARIGSQVVSGIGFLGVGTIITTHSKKVRGLTTAAGLWASACIGLALGIGYLEAGFAATLIVTIAMNTLQRVDRFFYRRSTVREYYFEVQSVSMVRIVMETMKQLKCHVIAMELEKDMFGEKRSIGILITIRLSDRELNVMDVFGGQEGILYIEEI